MSRFLEVSVVIASISVAMTACEKNGLRTVGQVEDFLRDNLPIGSDRSRVVQVLTDRKIENSGLPAPGDHIDAIIRDVSGNPLIRGSIAMKFFFDDRGTLARYEVREVFTGP